MLFYLGGLDFPVSPYPLNLGARHFFQPILGWGCDEALFSETKGFSVKKGGGNSVNGGVGKVFYRTGNSVKRSGRFSEPPDSEN